MKSKPTKKATASKSKTQQPKVNLAYVNKIANESISTIMALRDLIETLSGASLADVLKDKK